MDSSAFANPLFDPKDWVNKTLKNIDQNGDSEKSVSTCMVKLQMYYQKMNTELEDTSQNVMSNLPRVLHDLENIAKEASTLKQKMGAVKQEIANVEKNTGASISSLEKIDNIKMQLVNAKQALYEADNWTVLSTDIETVFETGDIDVIASKLVSMQQSLNALSNSSDYESKKIQLDGLKNRLEALASPYVVGAFTTKSIEKAKKFVKIFEDMGRFPLLVKYYSKCQKGSLLQQWQALVDLDTDDNLVETFQSYYDLLMTYWQEQIKWCEDVMPLVSGPLVLVELYTDVLTSLSPEFCQAIEDQLKRIEEPLPWLLQVKNCSKSFALNLRAKLKENEIIQITLLSLAKSIYLPYVQHFSKYSSIQKSVFAKHLDVLTKEEELMDTIQTLGQKNTKIVSIVVENRKLCIEISEGCCLPGYLTALESFLKSYLDMYKKISSAVIDKKGAEANVNTFQMCIALLQNLGEFTNSLKQLDQECVEAVLSIGNTLKKTDSEPFSAVQHLFLDTERQSELTYLVQTLSESTEPSALKTCHTSLESICRDVYQTSFTVIFSPVSKLLEAVPSAPAWKTKVATDLPDYSFSPQEYITQIGQYIMNLPQLLEPFLSLDNPSLNQALSVVGGEPFHEDADSGGFVELFLGRIAEATCRSFTDHILTIGTLSGSACKQLATDINYLGNVLEDLGFPLSEKLKNIATLVKLSPAEYGSESSGIPPQLVAAIRQMRGIISE